MASKLEFELFSEGLNGEFTKVVVRKKRGHITFAELQDALCHDRRFYDRHYAILINASSDGYQGVPGMEEPEGDSIEMFRLDEDEHCPICGELAPPDYCPECGAKLRGEQK